MPTLNELIEKMEPQNIRDKSLIRKCIDGLTVYASQQAQADAMSSKIPEMRTLIENLAAYWGLDDGSIENSKRDFLEPFEKSIKAAMQGAELDNGYQHSAAVIYGLYRYGEDMVCSQGDIAKDYILSASELMKEISSAWDFESHVLDDLTARLEAEVQSFSEPAMGGM